MSDMISRAAAIEGVKQFVDRGCETIHWTGVKAMLESLPDADVVPIKPLVRWLARYCELPRSMLDEDMGVFDEITLAEAWEKRIRNMMACRILDDGARFREE